ncbi:BatD family protein [Candidatus Fermentibacterales bacterium]|nr:BatD family protein [Candidatus Fermentibacterales bacterium]
MVTLPARLRQLAVQVLLLPTLAGTALSGPEDLFVVEVPDTLRAGETFGVTISTSAGEVTSLTSRIPSLSFAVYQSSGSSSSFRSVQTPGGSVMEQTRRVTISYRVAEDASGPAIVGPFEVYAGSSLGYVTLPSVETYILPWNAQVSGATTGRRTLPARGPGASAGGPARAEPAWVDIEGLEGAHFPGMPFLVTYYLYTRERFSHINVSWMPGENVVATQEEFRETMEWEYVAPGLWREHVVTLELTPAIPGSLVVPGVVLDAQRDRFGFFDHGTVLIESGRVSLPVYPFPESDMPDNFEGVIDSLSLELLRASRPSEEGQAGETCVHLTASGPGAESLRPHPPALTVSGPAELRPAGQREGPRGSTTWDFVLDPSDSGAVVIGPDSIAWFDPSDLSYHQSRIGPCTLQVRERPARSTPELPLPALDGSHSQKLLIAIILALPILGCCLFLVLHFRRKAGAAGDSASDLSQSSDMEELFTRFESCLTGMLCGRPLHSGRDGLEELLRDREIDPLLTRSILICWRDMELALCGRAPGPSELARATKRACELAESLEKALEARAGRTGG